MSVKERLIALKIQSLGKLPLPLPNPKSFDLTTPAGRRAYGRAFNSAVDSRTGFALSDGDGIGTTDVGRPPI